MNETIGHIFTFILLIVLVSQILAIFTGKATGPLLLFIGLVDPIVIGLVAWMLMDVPGDLMWRMVLFSFLPTMVMTLLTYAVADFGRQTRF